MEFMRVMTAAAVARYIARQAGSVKKCWWTAAVGLQATNSSTPPVTPQLFTSDRSTCAAHGRPQPLRLRKRRSQAHASLRPPPAPRLRVRSSSQASPRSARHADGSACERHPNPSCRAWVARGVDRC